jgi:hypothetical protein
MYTEIGRELAFRRVAVMEEFLPTFYAEWEGRDVDAIAVISRSLDAFAQRTVEIGDERPSARSTLSR